MTDHEHNRRALDPKLDDIIKKLDAANIETLRVKEELVQEKNELKNWQETHKQWCVSEFSRMDKIMMPIKEAFETVDKPARWVGRILVWTATGASIYLGQKTIVWISHHFNP